MIGLFFNVFFYLNKYLRRRYYTRTMDSTNESCAKLSENVSTSSNAINTRELEDQFYDDDDGDKCNIKFSPPAYIQRYQAVISVLNSPKYEGKIRKVVDFGCSELGFFTYLKNTPVIEEILCVDIDEFILECNKKKIDALTADYIHTRDRPLTASIYKGSVTDRDKNLENTDAVVCIELIEHLYDETLVKVPENIFGYIKPRVAIMTTPNADFNVLFRGMKGFRHPDHKFEWTRQQFTDWANGIVNKYPEYEVSFQGICPGPEGTEDLGCCSQMAIFHRNTDFVIKMPGIEGLYKLISQEIYPVRIDNRSDEDKILDEASYLIRGYQINNGDDIIPLETLAHMIGNIQIDYLKEIMENGGWETGENEEGPIIICRPLSVSLEDDNVYDEEDDFDYENGEDGDDYDDDPFDYNDFNSTSEIEIMDLDDEVFVHDVTNFSAITIGEQVEEVRYDELITDSLNSWNRDDEHERTGDTAIPSNSGEIRSMCSMFIERSQNDNSLVCPENITDPNFEFSTTHDSVDLEQRNENDDKTFSNTYNDNFQQTSTPRKKIKLSLDDLEKDNRPLENSQSIIRDFFESPSSSSAVGTEDAECSHALSMLNAVPINNPQSRAQTISDSESVTIEESPGVYLLKNTESHNLTDTASEISEDNINKNIH
ncbi:small RNA 2'-O-methyltransferase [Chelonus insularis]|uniref:small RNA 2'-O-methyltransferase n=1 Tax=Chelonus insularis TaxID=460826 RepID=UPI00158B1EB8|nr:small RNA 2'-O-methyltransferase [Chelonus insularis]